MAYCILELKKLLRDRLLFGFVMLCLCFNVGICFLHPTARAEIKAMRETAQELSQGGKFLDTLNVENLGLHYYDEKYASSDFLVGLMQEKYENLQASVDLLNAEDADLSYLAGDYTYDLWEVLFTYLLKALMLENMIFISLLCIRSFQIETQSETAAVVYSTRRGRKIALDKIFANGIVSAAAFLLLTALSVLAFQGIWRLGDLWNGNVASSFHTINDADDPIYNKPFITWDSFTLREYLICALLLAAALMVGWWLLSNAAAILWRNGLVSGGFLGAAVLLLFFLLRLLPQFDLPWLYWLNSLTISTVVYCNQWWFTDLSFYSLFAYQEVWSAILHLLIGLALVTFGIFRFKKGEL